MIKLLQVIEYKVLANQKIDWRNRSNVGFNTRLMGFYESPKEILACPYNCNVALVGRFDRVITGFSCGTIYLYSVLIVYS